MWSTIELAGHDCEVFEPTQPSEHQYVIVYLHGVSGEWLNDKPAFTEQFERFGLRVIGPRTQRSWWSDRICDEFDTQKTAESFVKDDVMCHIQDHWGVTTPRVALLGTSMGGQGALRLSYKYPGLFPVVAAISPAIDYHLRMKQGIDETLPQMYDDPEVARQDSALLHIHPLNWPRHQFFCCDPVDSYWFEGVDRLQMKLYSLGVPHEYDFETSAGGHGFAYYNVQAQKAVEFLVERMEQERLRLPVA